MERYDYFVHVYTDALEYVENTGLDLTDYTEDDLYDKLFALDEITGNGGNFYATEQECQDYLYQNLDVVVAALEEFDVSTSDLIRNKEHINQYLDCLARLSMLYLACTYIIRDLGQE